MFSEVSSENIAHLAPSAPLDRRSRKRLVRREALLAAASRLVAERGIDGLTMAALAEVTDYAPASLYTYFDSRSSMISALQERALLVLGEFAREMTDRWDDALSAEPLDQLAGLSTHKTARVKALAKLWAFSDLFLSAPRHHPNEFALQQQLLVSPGVEEVEDAASVVPTAMAVLDVPTALLNSARSCVALDNGEVAIGPLGDPVQVDLLRTFVWVTALNGALLVDNLATGAIMSGADLGSQSTAALLVGWGADPELVRVARELATEVLARSTDQDLRAVQRRTTGSSSGGKS